MKFNEIELSLIYFFFFFFFFQAKKRKIWEIDEPIKRADGSDDEQGLKKMKENSDGAEKNFDVKPNEGKYFQKLFLKTFKASVSFNYCVNAISETFIP